MLGCSRQFFNHVKITRSFFSLEIANSDKCSSFEVVRNSIESMCSRCSTFGCINSSLLVCRPLGREMSQVSISAFQAISLAFVVVVFLRFSSKRDILNFRVLAVNDIELRARLSKNINLSCDFCAFRS